MCDRPEDVEKLRKIVLDVATRGQLVDQREDDIPAHSLVKDIKCKKQALNQARKSRKYKGLIPDTRLHEIPDTWVWIKWKEIGICQNGKAFPSKDYARSGIRLLRPGNLHVSGRMEWTKDNVRYLDKLYAEHYSEYLIGSNELVMNLTAQSLKDEFLGRVCLTGRDERCLLNQRLARIVPVGFLRGCMKSLMR